MKEILLRLGIVMILLAGCQTTPPTSRTPSSSPLPQIPTPTPIVTPTPFSGSGRVKLGDITMYFEVHGEGKPLILLPGGLSSADAWINQVPSFSQQYRIIAPDSRGQGRTTDSDAAITYHLMAEDTLRMMDYLGIDSAYIVGWSDGAVIGLDLAIHHPERVTALVAYGAHTSPDGLQESVVANLRGSSVDDLQKGIEDDYRNMLPQPERLPMILEKIRTMWLTEPDFTAEELAGIEAPTLILDGENEEIVRTDHAAAIAKAIPGAKLILLPDIGHFAITEKPAEWNKVVLDFLQDH